MKQMKHTMASHYSFIVVRVKKYTSFVVESLFAFDSSEKKVNKQWNCEKEDEEEERSQLKHEKSWNGFIDKVGGVDCKFSSKQVIYASWMMLKILKKIIFSSLKSLFKMIQSTQFRKGKNDVNLDIDVIYANNLHFSFVMGIWLWILFECLLLLSSFPSAEHVWWESEND